MSSLSLRYNHTFDGRPHYLTNAQIEAVAREARLQLLGEQAEAMPMSVLADLSELQINDLAYLLWVSLSHPVINDEGQPALGLCEFDADCGEDAISIMVSPVGEEMSEQLALSTFAHELGHAIFDAPAWIAAVRQGPDLFDQETGKRGRRFRTTTTDIAHLSNPLGASPNRELDKQTRIAEFRANEFMGALLVPRARLTELATALAPDFDVGLVRPAALSEELQADTLQLVEQDAFGFIGMENLQRELAARFGVNPKFIRVRLERYGLLPGKTKIN